MGLTWVNEWTDLPIQPEVREGLRRAPHGGYAKIVTRRNPSRTAERGATQTQAPKKPLSLSVQVSPLGWCLPPPLESDSSNSLSSFF